MKQDNDHKIHNFYELYKDSEKETNPFGVIKEYIQ